MIPNLTVLTDIIAVKPDLPPERTLGGIYLPEVEEDAKHEASETKEEEEEEHE